SGLGLRNDQSAHLLSDVHGRISGGCSKRPGSPTHRAARLRHDNEGGCLSRGRTVFPAYARVRARLAFGAKAATTLGDRVCRATNSTALTTTRGSRSSGRVTQRRRIVWRTAGRRGDRLIAGEQVACGFPLAAPKAHERAANTRWRDS